VSRVGPEDRLGPPAAGIIALVRRLTVADLPACLALAGGELAAAAVVRALERLRVLERDGTITGYAAAWPNLETMVIGPVIAEDVRDAQALIADLAADLPDDRLRLDLEHRHIELRAWVADRGMPPVFDTSLMVRGPRELPGNRHRLFLPVMQALG
jgi:hypothetical protein